MIINKDTKVKDVMSKSLVTVDINDNLHTVEEQFNMHKIHHLPVMRNGELVGIISQGDLLILKDWGTFLDLKTSRSNNAAIFRTHTAEDIMSTALVTVKEDYTLAQIAQLMKPNKHHAFPVVTYGNLVGIITSYDMIQQAFGTKS